MRISKQNENCLRKASHQPPPSHRPQEADNCVTRFCFPKSYRLLKRKDYLRVFQEGNKFFGEASIIDYRFANSSKLGITVSKRFGKSNVRNHFKRISREAFRKTRPYFPKGLELNISPRGKVIFPSLNQIFNDLFALIDQIS